MKFSRIFLLLSLSSASCGAPATTAPTASSAAPAAPTESANASVTDCRVTDPVVGASIVGWPPETRAELESVMHEAVAVVAFDCARVRLLTKCTLPGRYAFVAGKKTAETSHAGGASAADLMLVTVGSFSATPDHARRSELRGECQGATHLVHRATLGAFRMRAATDAATSSSIAVLGGGVSASSHSSRATVQTEGDLASCDEPATTHPPRGCGAPIRLDLVPLDGP
jgi:hypothetical protein